MYTLTILFMFLSDALPEIDGEHLYVFTRYIAEIISTGDYDTVWLVLMPEDIQSALYDVGIWLAEALGW